VGGCGAFVFGLLLEELGSLLELEVELLELAVQTANPGLECLLLLLSRK